MRNWHRGAGNLKGGSINYSTSLINFIVTSLWSVGPKDKSPTVYIFRVGYNVLPSFVLFSIVL